MERLQLRHFAIFDHGGEVIFFLQSLLLHVKKWAYCHIKNFRAANPILYFLLLNFGQVLFFGCRHCGGFSSCEALPIKVPQFTFCECLEVSFFDSSNVFTPYRQRNRPTGICKRCITDELGGLFWGDVLFSFPLSTATYIKVAFSGLHGGVNHGHFERVLHLILEGVVGLWVDLEFLHLHYKTLFLMQSQTDWKFSLAVGHSFCLRRCGVCSHPLSGAWPWQFCFPGRQFGLWHQSTDLNLPGFVLLASHAGCTQ